MTESKRAFSWMTALVMLTATIASLTSQPARAAVEMIDETTGQIVIAHGPPPFERVVEHRHRVLRLVRVDDRPYLVDPDGHYFICARDAQGRLFPSYFDDATRQYYTAYYDPDYDRYYRVVDWNGGYYRHYFYGPDSYYPTTVEYVDEAPPPAYYPVIVAPSYYPLTTFGGYYSSPGFSISVGFGSGGGGWFGGLPVLGGSFLSFGATFGSGPTPAPVVGRPFLYGGEYVRYAPVTIVENNTTIVRNVYIYAPRPPAGRAAPFVINRQFAAPRPAPPAATFLAVARRPLPAAQVARAEAMLGTPAQQAARNAAWRNAARQVAIRQNAAPQTAAQRAEARNDQQRAVFQRLATQNANKRAASSRLASQNANRQAAAQRLASQNANRRQASQRLASQNAAKRADAKHLAEQNANRRAEAQRLTAQNERSRAMEQRSQQHAAARQPAPRRAAPQTASHKAPAANHQMANQQRQRRVSYAPPQETARVRPAAPMQNRPEHMNPGQTPQRGAGHPDQVHRPQPSQPQPVRDRHDQQQQQQQPPRQ